MTGLLSRAGRAVALLASVTALLTMSTTQASAHPLSTSAVLLDVDTSEVTATIDLPLDQLAVALDKQVTVSGVLGPQSLPGLRRYVQSHMSASDASGRT